MHCTMMRYVTPEEVMRSRFTEHAKPDWDVAVLCFRASRGSEALVQRLHAIPKGYKTLWGMDESSDRPFVYEAHIGGSRVGIVSRCMWGGPQAAILVEELACLGVTCVIGFGAAGSIVPDLAKGTQITATTGIVTDGTSRAYTEADEVGADPELYGALQSVEGNPGVDVIPVRVATVDAVYRETDADIQKWLGRGAQAINMETTPFYAASAACGVKSLWMGHISDCLANQEWDTWERPISMTEKSIEITVSLLESILV